MHPSIESHRTELAGLCRRYHVKRLELFGSATRADFDPRTSDLDFLVDFGFCTPGEHYDRYFGLLEDLRGVFGRKVDLVEEKAVRNPFFLRRMNESRTPLYAA